jgi:putative membrane protein
MHAPESPIGDCRVHRHAYNPRVIVAGLVFASLAALLHIYIFALESLLWTAPRTRATFGTSAEEAAATKELAFNQGFYNLFLAVVTAAGVIAVATGSTAVGAALIFAGIGSMLAAALVLLLSSPDKARAAITQGTLPLIGVVLLAVGLTL